MQHDCCACSKGLRKSWATTTPATHRNHHDCSTHHCPLSHSIMSNLRIEPSDHQVHFELSEQTPECSITLTSLDHKPLIFRVRVGRMFPATNTPLLSFVWPTKNLFFEIVGATEPEKSLCDLAQRGRRRAGIQHDCLRRSFGTSTIGLGAGSRKNGLPR